jgi:hypothetical protein
MPRDPVEDGPADGAATFAALFRAVYLTYHRRDGATPRCCRRTR